MSLFTTSINVLFGLPFSLLPGSFNLSLLLPIYLHCPFHSSLSIVPSHSWHLSIHAHLYSYSPISCCVSFLSNSSWPSCINNSLPPYCPSCPAGHCMPFVWPLPPYIHPMASSELTSFCVYTPACPHFNIYLLSSQKNKYFLCLACRSQQHPSFFSLNHFVLFFILFIFLTNQNTHLKLEIVSVLPS